MSPAAPQLLQGQQRGRDEQISYENDTLAFPLRRTLSLHPGAGLADDKGVLMGRREICQSWFVLPIPFSAVLHLLHHLGEENERHARAHKSPSHSQGAPDTMDFVTCVLDAAHLSAIKLFN